MKLTGPEILDKRITIQAPTKVPDGMGGFTVTWSDITTVWAKRTPHRSDESVQAMKETGMLTVNWRIRYRGIFKSDWRIKYGNVYGNVKGIPIEVNEGGGKHWFDITVEESN